MNERTAYSLMIGRIFFWLVLTSSFCVSQQVGFYANQYTNIQISGRFLHLNLQVSDSEGLIDTIPQLNSLHVNRTSSTKSDLFRSSVGGAIGAIVGVGIGGFIPVILRGEYNSRDFPTNAFYLRSYVSASVMAALSSAAALQLSRQREISYWRFASYSLIPPMILVMPLSVYASVTTEREELVKSVWIASLVSIGVSTLWSMLVYRMHPLRESEVGVRFGRPYFASPNGKQNRLSNHLAVGVKIMEVRF